jgi:hypothetical protein
MKKSLFILLMLIMSVTPVIAQRHHHKHRGPHRKVVVVKRSPFRPAKVVVYRPYWGPRFAYNRRWVYFPNRNFYWDNWRNHWVFWNGTVWISQTAPPPGVKPESLENEKKMELKEDEDDVDDVYKSNEGHKSGQE